MAKRVSAKLHHELSEYASLLRALRVRDTLDVTKHLTKANPFKIQDNQDEMNSGDDLELEDDLNPGPPTTATNSPDAAKSAKAKGKQKAVDTKQRRRDHWTRWPVPVDDVLKPEWSLEDEVAVVVSQVMRERSFPAFPIPVDDGDEDQDDPMFTVRDYEFDEEDPDHPFYIPYITANVADYLSNIFGALASLVPQRAASMQNRIEPLGWRTVLDVVVACTTPEFANPKVVENVIKRMQALYGPSILPLEGVKSTSFRAVERMLGKEEARKKMSSRLDEEVAKYWQPRPLELPETPPKETGKRRRSAMDEHMEAEFRGRTKAAPKKKRREPRKKSIEHVDATAIGIGTPGPSVQEKISPKESSSQKQASVRRSARSRRTNEVQVLDKQVFMD